MANNLFISYDLNTPGQDYSNVIEAIKSLGTWAKVQKSVWYVSSRLGAEGAAKKVRPHMDQNDSLIVIDATNKDAYWFNLPDEVSKQIQSHWSS